VGAEDSAAGAFASVRRARTLQALLIFGIGEAK
jgi:hypothetical protein